MEVPNGWLNAREFVPIVHVFLVVILAHLQSGVIAGKLIGVNCVHLVERVLSGWMIEDEGFCIEVGIERD